MAEITVEVRNEQAIERTITVEVRNEQAIERTITVEPVQMQIQTVTVQSQLATNQTAQGDCPDLLNIYRSATL